MGCQEGRRASAKTEKQVFESFVILLVESTEMKLHKLLLIVGLLLVFASMIVSGRTMWGVRKKQKKDDEEISAETLLNGLSASMPKGKKPKHQTASQKASESTRKAESRRRTMPKSHTTSTTNEENDGKPPLSLPEMIELYKTYIDKMEDLLLSGQFEQFLNPQLINDIFSKIQETGSSYPDLEPFIAQLNIDDLHDLSQMKEKLLEGLSYAREFLNGMNDFVDHPEKLTEMIASLPSDIQPMVEGLLNGNNGPIKEFIQSIPGTGIPPS
jgi:hypothetical protein